MHHACMSEIEIFKVRWSQFSTLGENIRRWSTHFTVSTNTHWEIHPNVQGRQMVKGHVRLAKVWKAHWPRRGISHLRNILLQCQVLSHGAYLIISIWALCYAAISLTMPWCIGCCRHQRCLFKSRCNATCKHISKPQGELKIVWEIFHANFFHSHMEK